MLRLHVLLQKNLQVFDIRLYLTTFLVLGLILLRFYQHQIDMDGVSYISIAHKYVNGDIGNAINGYWGMLYSVLLVPLILINIPDLLATKILALVMGVLILVVLNKLLSNLNFNLQYKHIFFIIAIPSLLYFSMDISTPDLLLAFWILCFLNLLFDKSYRQKPLTSVILGIIGGLSYLTKQYSLFFLTCDFLIINLVMIYFKKIKRAQFIKNSLIFFSVMYIVSLMWIIPVSFKYGKLTLGNAGSYNWAVRGPEGKGEPFDSNRLIEPPNNTALSIWEDPSFENVKYWNPFSSLDSLKYQFFLIRKNTAEALRVIFNYSIMAIPVIILAVIHLYTRAKQKKNDKVAYILITICLYIFGYTFFLIDERYFWIIFILVLVLAVGIFSSLNQNKDKRLKIAIITAFIFLFTYYPVGNLIKNANRDDIYYIIGQQMTNNQITKTRLATNKYGRKTLFLAFHTESKYLGQTGDYDDLRLLKNILVEHGINYYLVWENEKYKLALTNFLGYDPIVLSKELVAFKIN